MKTPDLPPGQSPVKDMSEPQSLTFLHVPCSWNPSQRVWDPFGDRKMRNREGLVQSPLCRSCEPREARVDLRLRWQLRGREGWGGKVAWLDWIEN